MTLAEELIFAFTIYIALQCIRLVDSNTYGEDFKFYLNDKPEEIFFEINYIKMSFTVEIPDFTKHKKTVEAIENTEKLIKRIDLEIFKNESFVKQNEDNAFIIRKAMLNIKNNFESIKEKNKLIKSYRNKNVQFKSRTTENLSCKNADSRILLSAQIRAMYMTLKILENNIDKDIGLPDLVAVGGVKYLMLLDVYKEIVRTISEVESDYQRG